MNNSFKFIVNPSDTTQIEITSLLQYCALKNILSEFNCKKIKSLSSKSNEVYFSRKNRNFNLGISFTTYIQKSQSERDALKTTCLEDIDEFSLFFNAISEIEYPHSFRDLRPYGLGFSTYSNYLVNDLYTIFKHREYAKKYLSKYIPKTSEEVCYAQIPKTTNKYDKIYYDDSFINFTVIEFDYKNKESDEEYIKLIKCINENVDFQFLRNKGYIENIVDDLCIYTKDPAIIHKVLMNNQSIIDTMVSDILYIHNRQQSKYSCRHVVSNELQSSITDVVNIYESRKKKAEDNLVVLNDLIN